MRQPLPVRTRATTARERLAIETAVADIVGPDEANRLVELGETIRTSEHRPDEAPTATQRHGLLMETPEGRARLERTTWRPV